MGAFGTSLIGLGRFGNPTDPAAVVTCRLARQTTSRAATLCARLQTSPCSCIFAIFWDSLLAMAPLNAALIITPALASTH